MESGNSGSMKSSSGGEEEYDSRNESLSSLLNSSNNFGSISGQQPILFSTYQPTFSNPHSHNVDAFPQSLANSSAYTQYGNDLAWSQGLNSHSNYYNFVNSTSLPSSASASTSSMTTSSQSMFEVQGFNQAHLESSLRSNEGSGVLHKDDTHKSRDRGYDTHVIAKTPKKRTRASRRAPTTVLTTNTTNFRQMVQEFTGIPAGPFSGLPYSSRRLDLFLNNSAQSDSLGLLHPIRPSAQKVSLPQFLGQDSSTSFLSSTLLGGTTDNPSSTTNPGLGILEHHQNVLNMQSNQSHEFQQPFLQSFLRPSSNSGTRSSQGNSISVNGMGLNHENVNTNVSGFQSQESADTV